VVESKSIARSTFSEGYSSLVTFMVKVPLLAVPPLPSGASKVPSKLMEAELPVSGGVTSIENAVRTPSSDSRMLTVTGNDTVSISGTASGAGVADGSEEVAPLGAVIVMVMTSLTALASSAAMDSESVQTDRSSFISMPAASSMAGKASVKLSTVKGIFSPSTTPSSVISPPLSSLISAK